jgi:uncharacterized protein YutE (UPF0331/DUF86 family)
MPSSAREALHELALERGLHVCAEAIFDVGHHVLAGRGLQIPATYREVIPALVAAGVLTAQLGGRLTGSAGLRNLLVHDYAVIDAPVLWQLLEDRLDDLSCRPTGPGRPPATRSSPTRPASAGNVFSPDELLPAQYPEAPAPPNGPAEPARWAFHPDSPSVDEAQVATAACRRHVLVSVIAAAAPIAHVVRSHVAPVAHRTAAAVPVARVDVGVGYLPVERVAPSSPHGQTGKLHEVHVWWKPALRLALH